MSEKISVEHLKRAAYVYIRQSTSQQVRFTSKAKAANTDWPNERVQRVTFIGSGLYICSLFGVVVSIRLIVE